MYPILMRLSDRGLLETSWETEHVPGRPARHLNRITGTGLAYITSMPEPAQRTRTSAAGQAHTRLAGA